MGGQRRAKLYLGLATALSVLLVGTWRTNVGLFGAGFVPLAVKTGLSFVALALAVRGLGLRNGAMLPVAIVGTVFAAGATVLVLVWAPTGLLGSGPWETAVTAIALVPLAFALVAIQGNVDPLGTFLGRQRR